MEEGKIKYRLWVCDKTTNEVFYLDYNNRDVAEKQMDWYLKTEPFYVIKLEEILAEEALPPLC